MADLKIDERTKQAKATADAAELARALRKGTDGMREAGTKYLPKWDKETPGSWKARLDSSFLFGAYDQAIQGHSGRLFSKPVVLRDDVPDEIRGWWENIDLGGQHGDVFSVNAFSHSLDAGIGFILTDFPENGGKREGGTDQQQTKADEIQAGARPYCTYIPAEHVLGWRTERIAGSEVLTMVRILEETEEPLGVWDERLVRRVRIYFADTTGIRFQLHRQNEKKDWIIESEGELIKATRIPLRPFYARRKGFFTGLPWMQTMAEKNLEHWQSASDQRAGLHFARVGALKAIGMREADFKVQGFGHGTILFNPNPEGDIDWLAYPVGGVTIGERDLDKIVEQLSVLGLEPLLHKSGDPTATEKAINEARANSRLLQAARSFGDTLEGVFEDMAMWAGLETSGQAQINEDFGLDFADAAELSQIVEMRKLGDISRETMWAEMKRRGVLMSDFDAEIESTRLDSESDALKPGAEGLRSDFARKVVARVAAGEDVETAIDAVSAGEQAAPVTTVTAN